MRRTSAPWCGIVWLAIVAAGAIPAFSQENSKPESPAPTPKKVVALLGDRLESTRKVAYKTIGGQTLLMHVFEPTGHRPSDRRACFLIIHGGGWRGGNPREFYPFAQHAAQRGMLGVSLQYRLPTFAPGATPYDCVKDGRSAVRYLRQHAAELGIDPQKIVAAGGSAGGHIAAGTALFDGWDEAGEDAAIPCRPDALVLFYPVIDTSREGYGNERLGERWREISPLHQVRPGVSPTLIFHGTADTVTPFKGAEAFRAAMQAAGNRCDLSLTREEFTDTLFSTWNYFATRCAEPITFWNRLPQSPQALKWNQPEKIGRIPELAQVSFGYLAIAGRIT